MQLNFYDYFPSTFAGEYKEICNKIKNNLMCAYYDIAFLNHLSKFSKRDKKLEHCSLMLIYRLKDVFWADLILNATKLLSDAKDECGISMFNKRLENNKIKDFPNPSKTDYEQDKIKLQSIRKSSIAHCLFDSESTFDKLDTKLMNEIIDKINNKFRELNFSIDNEIYFITNEDVDNIEKCCKMGMDGLFKKSAIADIYDKLQQNINK